jgi:hypothetical protein
LGPVAFACLRFAAFPTGFDPIFTAVALRRADLSVLRPDVFPFDALRPPDFCSPLVEAPVALGFVPEAAAFLPGFTIVAAALPAGFAFVAAALPAGFAFASAAAFPAGFAFVEVATFLLFFTFASAFGASARFSGFADLALPLTD